MKHESNSGGDEARLSALLREARPSPGLPGHFREGVWRRLERTPTPETGWLEALGSWLLRPRVVAAGLAGLVVLGGLTGAVSGSVEAREVARSHYLTSVAPNLLR